MVPVIIALVVVLVLVLFVVLIYNGLVTKRNRVDEANSQIQVQLKRRHDLIPNLVNAVKGYMDFEKGVLLQVTQARGNAISAGSQGIAAQAQAENVLTGASSLSSPSSRTTRTLRPTRTCSRCRSS